VEKTDDNLVAGAPQDAELLAQTNEHALRPLSRLAPELQTATWELIRRIEQRPAGTTIEAVVDSIKEAIASGWEERAVTATDTNSRELNPVCHGGSTAQTGVTRTRRILERQSDQLGNLCRWAGRITNWDPEAIALGDDKYTLERHLKSARQLRTFCEALIAALELRLAT
jgi:hypothetical protein